MSRLKSHKYNFHNSYVKLSSIYGENSRTIINQSQKVHFLGLKSSFNVLVKRTLPLYVHPLIIKLANSLRSPISYASPLIFRHIIKDFVYRLPRLITMITPMRAEINNPHFNMPFRITHNCLNLASSEVKALSKYKTDVR